MRAFIYVGGSIYPENITEHPKGEDLRIAADGGYANAKRLGERIDIAVGDFDSFAKQKIDEGVELVRDVCTYTFLPSGEAVGGEIRQATNNNIDHIFINDKVQAKLFNVVVDHDVAHISDHLPIYADIILK